MTRFWLFLTLCLACAPACAQTTRPTPPAWQERVDALATCLTTDGGACAEHLSDDCSIRSFDRSTRELADLAAHTGGAVLLMAKSYSYPRKEIASDIGASAAASGAPDEIKHVLMPVDGEPTTQANKLAEQWVKNELNLAQGEAFAVLVFFTADTNSAVPPEKQILFVLCKGHADAEGKFVVTQIVYGDPRQAALASAR